MVLHDRRRPPAEPWKEGFGDRGTRRGVRLQALPFEPVGLARLVQDATRDPELADVVQERCPAEPVAVLVAQIELAGQHVGVGADPFRVAAGLAIVRG